jgi:hypothetical protein
MRVTTAFVVALVLAAGFAACSEKSATPPTPTAQSITVAGNLTLANKNETTQLTATLAMSDGSTKNVTSTATWASSNTAVATVNSGGVATAVSNGTTVITVTSDGKSQTATVTVAMKATPSMTPFFMRLCNPKRAGMDLTISEKSGNIGMTVTSVTIIMVDIYGVTRFSKTYSALEISALIGNNHLNAGETRVMSITATYPGGVETEDSKASVTMTVTDDAGNSTTLSQANITQHDRC